MTDTATPVPQLGADGQSVVLDINFLRQLYTVVVSLDEQVAAASGDDRKIRASVLDRYAVEHSKQVDFFINAMVDQLSDETKVSRPVLAGILARIEYAFEERLDPLANSIVQSQVEEAKSKAKGNLDVLKERRRDAAKQLDSIRGVLEQINVDTSSVPEPKRGGGRTAGSGSSSSSKSGQNPDKYRFMKNGKPIGPTQNQFSALAFHSTLGCAQTPDGNPARWGAEDLRTYLTERGVTMGPPGQGDDEWEVTLPNDTKIGARRLSRDLDPDIVKDDDEPDDSSDDSAQEPEEAPAEQASA